jgi:uncharacterized DUF497 family protein
MYDPLFRLVFASLATFLEVPCYMRFLWDPTKARSNLSKHGLSFENAISAIRDPLGVTGYDPDHSIGEDRYITFGQMDDGQIVVVSHTDNNDEIRIISCRLATLKERKIYETA